MRWWVIAITTLLAGKISAADVWDFQPDDTIEQIQAKIEHNGYAFTVKTNRIFNLSPEEKKRFHGRYRGTYKPPLKSGIGPLQKHLTQELPGSFDWRDQDGHS